MTAFVSSNAPCLGKTYPHLAVVIAVAVALACTMPADAQLSASIDLASKNRYRSTDIGPAGPVVGASLMEDATAPLLNGAYVGLSGVWRVRDGGLASAAALIGWSGRMNTLQALSSLDPRWGWDVAAHRQHYGTDSRYDFDEAMVGLLAPGWSARVWWSPHYFGGLSASVYSEINGSLNWDPHWRTFAHVGALRFSSAGEDTHMPGRNDALLGAGFVTGRWDFRLLRDRLISGIAFGDIDTSRSRSSWVLSVGVAL